MTNLVCVTQSIHDLKQMIATFGDDLTYQDIVKKIHESHNKEGKFDIDKFSHDMFILHIIISDEERERAQIEMDSRSESDVEVINEDVEDINGDITLADAIVVIKARIPDENCSDPVDTLGSFMLDQFVVYIDFVNEELKKEFKDSDICVVHVCVADEILATGIGSNYEEACTDAARRALRRLGQDDGLLTSLVRDYYLPENESSECDEYNKEASARAEWEYDRREYQDWLDQRHGYNDEY